MSTNTITHIELSNGLETWRIAASQRRSPNTVRNGIIITSTKGMMQPGELTEEPIDRSYSDGSVFNPNATRSGKEINIPIVFYSPDSAQRANSWDAFEAFLLNSSIIMLRTFGDTQKTWTCQYQGAPEGDDYTDCISINLVLKAKEAR